MKKRSTIALTEPQAAFAAFTHGELNILTYFMRTIPGMEEYLVPLDTSYPICFYHLFWATPFRKEKELFTKDRYKLAALEYQY